MMAALLATLALAAPPAASAAADGIAGIWINPRASVAVRTGDCRSGLCGWIVWADANAQQDARESGVSRLVGIELLRNYRAAGAGRWTGSVFVPDMGRSFASTIQLIGPDSLRIKGCLIGGFICRAQVWHRVAERAAG